MFLTYKIRMPIFVQHQQKRSADSLSRIRTVLEEQCPVFPKKPHNASLNCDDKRNTDYKAQVFCLMSEGIHTDYHAD